MATHDTCTTWPHMTVCDGMSHLTIIYLKRHQ